MDTLLIKIFATALTFSQVATAPDRVKTEFDPIQDRQQVVSLLRAGCAQMRKAFDIEDLNVDDLIATAMDDPDAVAGGYAAFRGINIGDLHVSYRQFCKNETVPNSPVDVGEVIEFYNRTLADLPDHTRLKGMRLPGMSEVLDLKGERFAEVYEPDQRRVWVDLADIPVHVRKAFVAAEDKRFYQHKGIDERALIRAFIGNLAQSGRPQGGSTITQQTVKHILVGEDVTLERKLLEMILASRGRKQPLKRGDPGTLSQFHFSRPWILGHRDGGAQLFRQIGFSAGIERSCAACRDHQRAKQFQSRSQSGPCQATVRLCPDQDE